MNAQQKLLKSKVTLHDSLSAFSQATGVKQATVHLACVTKKGEVLFVPGDGMWGLPKRQVPMQGTLILLPDDIIKKELQRDPKYVRGVSPAYGDTKVLGQYEDGEGGFHFVLRVNISYTGSRLWMYAQNRSQFAQLGECDEVARITAIELGLCEPMVAEETAT